jgi:hypothetical protein
MCPGSVEVDGKSQTRGNTTKGRASMFSSNWQGVRIEPWAKRKKIPWLEIGGLPKLPT